MAEILKVAASSLPAQIVGTEISVPLEAICGDWSHNASRQFLNAEHAKAALAELEDSDEFKELAKSIREKGLLNPLVIRPIAAETNLPACCKGKAFRMVAGFRRHRALAKNEAKTAAVKVAEIDSQTADELNLIENVVRKSISKFELATAAVNYYRNHKKADGKRYESEEVGKRFGLSGSYIRGLTMCREKLDDEILLAWASRNEEKDFSSYKATAYPFLLQFAALDKKGQLAAFHFQVLKAQGKTDEEANKILAEGGFTFKPQTGTNPRPASAKGIKRDAALTFQKTLRKIDFDAEHIPFVKGAQAAVDFLLGKRKTFSVDGDVLFDPKAEASGDVDPDENE